MKLKLALICGLVLTAAGQAMACYTVYDNGNRVLYQGAQPPVDMSRPLHESMPRRFPGGGSLVFEQGATCPPVSVAQLARPGAQPPNTAVLGAGPAHPGHPSNSANSASSGSRAVQGRSATQGSPMLTDRRTANALRVPYTHLEGNIVVVPPEAAARVMRPTLTVVPSGITPPAPMRTSMGASAASPTAAMGAGREQVMITELYDPPMTIVQRGANVSVTRN